MPRKPPPPKPQLAVIPSRPPAGPSAPAHLGEVARGLWHDVIGAYEFSDPASVRILAEACSALDRSERCRAAIDRDGESYRTRTGLLKPHPLLTAEIQSRALACRLLARLGLDLEPVHANAGRPPGGAVGISWQDKGA